MDDTVSSVIFFSQIEQSRSPPCTYQSDHLSCQNDIYLCSFFYFSVGFLIYLKALRFDSQYNYLKMKAQALAMLLLVWLAYSDGTITETHVDFVGTYLNQGTSLLKRVQKKADVRYTYTLNSVDRWNQFPDLAIQFQTQFDQYVLIKYHISASTFPATNLNTRLIIDSQENRDFRSSGANVYYHSNAESEQVWLKKGKHLAKVEYRTDSSYINNPGTSDWQDAYFIIRYYST